MTSMIPRIALVFLLTSTLGCNTDDEQLEEYEDSMEGELDMSSGRNDMGLRADEGGQPDEGRADMDPGPAVAVPAGISWQWQLDTGDVDRSVDVELYDVDLFDTPKATIESLRGQGRVVICYFSAGSKEDWRADAGDFGSRAVGEALGDWPGEFWLDVRADTVRDVMTARMDLAVSKGCDGVEPDNVDGYANESGFALTREHQLAYLRFLSTQAHERGLAVGLKNAVELIEEMEPLFDFAVNEECLAYDECYRLAPFLAADKAVLHVEYVDDKEDGEARKKEVCSDASVEGFSTLIKHWDLDAWRLSCD